MSDTASDLRERITALRSTASPLEPDAVQRDLLRAKAWEHADRYLEHAPDWPPFLGAEQGSEILAEPFDEEPGSIEEALAVLARHVDRPGSNQASGNFLAFIPVSSLYHSAVADYLATVTNRFAGLYFGAPGAVRIERALLRWLAGVIGYPASAAGDLTSGGSIANLSAIVTAREAHQLRSADYSHAVVYLSEQAHYSVGKALRIAGLQDCIRRSIPLDERFRMRVGHLEQAILADQANGLRPWLIVAGAGTTDTGAVDPLPAIAEVAATHKLWLHVDGAYGAMFALCERGKQALRGIELSDSLTVDPHKGLFVPCGTGGVLVRNGRYLWQAHTAQTGYLEQHQQPSDELSPSELSPELTRPFRGLRLWLPLKLAGVAAFRAALEEKLLLARYLYETIRAIDGFEMGPEPDLSVVLFRYLPPRGDANAFNQRLAAALQQDGRMALSTVTLQGRCFLRAVVLNLRTHVETIDMLVDLLREKVGQLSESA